VNPEEARAYLNHLLTLNIRGEEAFGPLAMTFIREHNLDELGLLPEERFNLLMATVQALANEPKRFNVKLELLEKARGLLPGTSYQNPALLRQLDNEIGKTRAELGIYNEAMRTEGRRDPLGKQRIIIESDAPEYFIHLAPKRASEYYQKKFGLTKQAKTAQHFSGAPRRFEPENPTVHKEFSGACGPFMNARTGVFHLMLPFDLKISRKPEGALDASVRIFYSKEGYSFPLAYEMDKLVSYHDGEALDISIDDPNLLFVSASRIKEREFRYEYGDPSRNLPPEFVYPVTVLERTATLGTFVQVVTNFKVWFDASVVSLLIQGAPDLQEYGLLGGSGLMTRSHAADKVDAYSAALKDAWRENLSFNFVNIHLQLAPGVDTALVPYNTPLFTLIPTLSAQNYKVEDARNLAGR